MHEHFEMFYSMMILTRIQQNVGLLNIFKISLDSKTLLYLVANRSMTFIKHVSSVCKSIARECLHVYKNNYFT